MIRKAFLALAAVCCATFVGAQGIEYTPPSDSAGLPPLKRATVTVPQASVATLASAPYTILAGVSGVVRLPEAIRVDKPAGTAWTVGTSGQLRVGPASNATLNYFTQFNQAVTTAFFESAAVQTWLGNQPLDQLGVQWPGTHDIGGDAVVLRLATADISGGTGDLTVTVWYREWPEAP